jgi:hypothetical protein
MLVSDESLVDAVRRDAAELRLRNELRIIKEELRQVQEHRAAFELEVLNSRDYAVGQAVQIGELRFRLIKQAAVYEGRIRQLQSDYLVHETNHRQHIARLEAALNEAASVAASAERLRREIADLRSSATWRLGRLLLLPVRVVKRLLRRG